MGSPLVAAHFFKVNESNKITKFEHNHDILPTVFYQIGFRFYFVSFDCSEPPHIHVGDDAGKICKYWLKNGSGVLADNSGFSKRELRKIEKIINETYDQLKNTFDEFCKNYKK
jgi:hypothetical protein